VCAEEDLCQPRRQVRGTWPIVCGNTNHHIEPWLVPAAIHLVEGEQRGKKEKKKKKPTLGTSSQTTKEKPSTPGPSGGWPDNQALGKKARQGKKSLERGARRTKQLGRNNRRGLHS